MSSIAHSSSGALARAGSAISAYSLAMIAADEVTRRDLAHATRDAEDALERRRSDLRLAEAMLSHARTELNSAEHRVSAARARLHAARTVPARNQTEAAQVRANVREAEADLATAQQHRERAHDELQEAVRREREARDTLARCRHAGERIRRAESRYRRAAANYVAASTATVALGRQRLGRLSSLLDSYLAISAYDGHASASASHSQSASSSPRSDAARISHADAAARSSARQRPSWAEERDLWLVPLADIMEEGAATCSAQDRWDIERFDAVVEGVLDQPKAMDLLSTSDAEAGRTAPRTLRDAARRVLDDGIVLTGAPPHTIIAGRGLVAAARRAGLPWVPARMHSDDEVLER